MNAEDETNIALSTKNKKGHVLVADAVFSIGAMVDTDEKLLIYTSIFRLQRR